MPKELPCRATSAGTSLAHDPSAIGGLDRIYDRGLQADMSDQTHTLAIETAGLAQM